MQNIHRVARRLIACAAISCAPLAHADLVTNGGFESGNLTGWTVTNHPLAGLGLGHTGKYGAVMQTVTAQDTISQTIATQAGAAYEVSFWLTQAVGADNDFIFNWDGGTPELSLLNAPVQGYKQYTFTLTASSASTSISFGGRNGPGYFVLDDIAVNPGSTSTVPAPATLPLFGLALVLAGAATRRKRTAVCS